MMGSIPKKTCKQPKLLQVVLVKVLLIRVDKKSSPIIFLGLLPRVISLDVQQSIKRILTVFDDSVQLGLVRLRATEIKRLFLSLRSSHTESLDLGLQSLVFSY